MDRWVDGLTVLAGKIISGNGVDLIWHVFWNVVLRSKDVSMVIPFLRR